jgi:hypothetical protein
MSRTGKRIGLTVLALGVSLLAIPTLLEAQKGPGYRASAGRRSVAQVLDASISKFSGLA